MDEDPSLLLSCVQEVEESSRDTFWEESHDPESSMDSAVADHLKCPICGKILQTMSGLRRHKKRHTAPSRAVGRPKGSKTGKDPTKSLLALQGSDLPPSSEASHALNIAVARRALQNITYGRVEATRRIQVPDTVKVSKKRSRISATHKTKVGASTLGEASGLIHADEGGSASLQGDDDRWEEIDSEDPLKLSAMKFATNCPDSSNQSKLNPVKDGWNILFTNSSDEEPSKPLSLRACHHQGSEGKEPLSHPMSTASSSWSNNEVPTKGSTTENGEDEVSKTLLGQRILSVQPVCTKLAGTAALLQEGMTKLLGNSLAEDQNGERERGSSGVAEGQRIKFANKLRVCISKLKMKNVHSGVWKTGKTGKKPKGTDLGYVDKSARGTTEKKDTSGKNTAKKRRNRKKAPTFCEICQKDFRVLKRHLLLHSSTRKFKCEECGKAYYEKRVLDKHVMTHIKKYKCSFCGEMFSKVRAARRHARTHLAEKPYVCEICKHQSRTRRELRKHMVLHSDFKRFICDTCGHGSHTRAGLTKHQQSHTFSKQYVCETCGKAFKYASGLRVHSFAHTSGKPYRCVVCSESFAHNYLLKRHRLTHIEQQTSADGAEMSALNIPPITDAFDDTGDDQSAQEIDLPGTFLDEGKACLNNFGVSSDDTEPASHVEKSVVNVTSDSVPGVYLAPRVDQDLGNEEAETSLCMSKRKAKGLLHHQESNVSPVQQHTASGSSATDTKNRRAPQITVLGRDLLKQNLTYGQGSRNQTLENTFVVPLCDGSFKALKNLQQQCKKIGGQS